MTPSVHTDNVRVYPIGETSLHMEYDEASKTLHGRVTSVKSGITLVRDRMYPVSPDQKEDAFLDMEKHLLRGT